MAHTCPECGYQCHCNGDIDDIDFGDSCPEADRCICCLGEFDDGESWEDYEDFIGQQ